MPDCQTCPEGLIGCSLLVSVGKLPQRSSLWALSLSLSAVNLSESAQGKMAPAQFAQIYVTAATALRTVLGHHLTFLPVRIFFTLRLPLAYRDKNLAGTLLFLCLPGIPPGVCGDRGQPVGDQADPRLPALALHPTGSAVFPQL